MERTAVVTLVLAVGGAPLWKESDVLCILGSYAPGTSSRSGGSVVGIYGDMWSGYGPKRQRWWEWEKKKRLGKVEYMLCLRSDGSCLHRVRCLPGFHNEQGEDSACKPFRCCESHSCRHSVSSRTLMMIHRTNILSIFPRSEDKAEKVIAAYLISPRIACKLGRFGLQAYS